MIAAISLLRRRDDIDAARFRWHWLDILGPLVCRNARPAQPRPSIVPDDLFRSRSRFRPDVGDPALQKLA